MAVRIATISKMIFKGAELNLKNCTGISCGVTELLRKVSRGREKGEGIG